MRSLLKPPCYNGLGFRFRLLCRHLFTSAALVLRLAISFLSHQEQGVEHDRLSEGNSQNRLDQNLR
jgi:hypothetical protein